MINRLLFGLVRLCLKTSPVGGICIDQVVLAYEKRRNLPVGSILKTILTEDVVKEWDQLEKGRGSVEEFEPRFTEIYDKQVSRFTSIFDLKVYAKMELIESDVKLKKQLHIRMESSPPNL